MKIFDAQDFRQFLGLPFCHKKHAWGTERLYKVSESTLADNEELLKDTIYHHHSSFDFSDEIAEIGYPLVAQAMRQRNSGNPTDAKTRMGNLGEVFGTEFSRAFLRFETTLAFPKRLNPNIDQSMKGVDIIGLRDVSQRAELLIGEAKSSKRYDKQSIEEAYEHLIDLHAEEASRILRFMKEVLSLRGERQLVENVDRHMARRVPRRYLILSITQSAPKDPFDVIASRFKKAPIPQLLAVHIQISNLKGRPADGKRDEDENWLSKLFAP